jgi:transcriptional regulator with XRE-family HTH domain
MTVRAASHVGSTAGKVNHETKARVKVDELVEVWQRALAATAGNSNTIDDHTHKLIFDRGEYDLFFEVPHATPWPGTAYADDDFAFGFSIPFSFPYTSIRPLELGGGVSVVGGQPNPESVIDHIIPMSVSPVNADPIAEYRTLRRAATDGRRDALAHVSKSLDAAAAVYAQDAPQDVIRQLTDLGVNQLVIARALGVTPTAVRKWKRGETAKSDHRGRLARLAATHALLTETGLHDPAGWLDIPISSESTLTPLDLFIGGRADLSVLLAARLMEPHEVLDAYAPAWRQTYPIDPDYEVVMLGDGSRSAVPRKRGGAN